MEMLTWRGSVLVADPIAGFDDTITSLVTIFLTHKHSPYHGLRHKVQLMYSRRVSYISRDFGNKHISGLTLSDFKEVHAFWLAPKKDGKRRVSHAHEQIVFVRQLFRFGKALKLKGCRDAKDILDDRTSRTSGGGGRSSATSRRY